MTEEQHKLCLGLIRGAPPPIRQVSEEEFLNQFRSAIEGGKLAVKLLDDASKARNAEDLQGALVVGYAFGFGPEHIDILCSLIDDDWHYSHEDVVGALDMLRTPKAIDALFSATQWIPQSLEYDASRALAVKAIWALGNLQSREADIKLEALARADDVILRSTAAEQLERRRQAT